MQYFRFGKSRLNLIYFSYVDVHIRRSLLGRYLGEVRSATSLFCAASFSTKVGPSETSTLPSAAIFGTLLTHAGANPTRGPLLRSSPAPFQHLDFSAPASATYNYVRLYMCIATIVCYTATLCNNGELSELVLEMSPLEAKHAATFRQSASPGGDSF